MKTVSSTTAIVTALEGSEVSTAVAGVEGDDIGAVDAESGEAERPTGAGARPFLKWAGGKRSMLPHLLPLVPRKFGTYHEPFVGGGALFWALDPARAMLSDNNPELVNVYNVVRDDVSGLIAELEKHRYEEAHYYDVRASDPNRQSPVERAARTVFLNKTCFNGLYRVNRSGKFNVPFGRYTNPVICDEANMRACSRALQGVAVDRADFEIVAKRAMYGDFVYFDPPYLPISSTSSFTGYTADGFGLRDHRRLRDVARELKMRGVHVLLSNSAAPAIRELYADGFEIQVIGGARSINAKGAARGKIEELIIQ